MTPKVCKRYHKGPFTVNHQFKEFLTLTELPNRAFPKAGSGNAELAETGRQRHFPSKWVHFAMKGLANHFPPLSTFLSK